MSKVSSFKNHISFNVDYSFFILRVADLEKATLDELLSFALKQDLNITNSYFNDVHEGFNSTSMKMTLAEAPDPVKLVVSKLSHIFDPLQFWSIEINKLAPGGKILEHTDQSSTVVSGHKVPLFHTVHIPLTGRGMYSFRRSQKLNFESRPMDRGSAYLFNNYTLHKVDNVGGVDRYNFMLHFFDPDWSSKRKIYELYDIKGLY